MIRSNVPQRCEAAVAAVLPPSVRIQRDGGDSRSIGIKLNGKRIEVAWLGEGGLRQARELIASRRKHPDVAAARRMSPGACEALSTAGIGWVDETGAAEIALGSLIISRTGRSPEALRRPLRWTPSVLAVAEALLCGGRATVDTMRAMTGLSAGSAVNGLRVLTDLGLLIATARRGRDSGRQVPDPDRLLDAYAVASAVPAVSLALGVTWRDPVAGLAETGRQWDSAGIPWAATGTLAAAVLAPYLTNISASKVYVDRRTIAELEAAAARVGPASDRGRTAHLAPVSHGHGPVTCRSKGRPACCAVAPSVRRPARRRRAW